MISAEAFLRRNPVVLQDEGDAEPENNLSGAFNGGEAASVNADGRRRIAAWNTQSSGVVNNENSGDTDACREAALRLLDAAPRSSGALRDRLLGKGYAEDVVDGVVARLIEVHLIDDLDYAESVVRICANRMMGRRGTMMELARKGVDRVLAAQVADEAEQNGVFEEAAWELGRRVACKTEGLERQVRQRRFWSAGGRKGHNPTILREVAAALLG